MRILITAGPTREYLDDVRFLSNASSGKMGYALADAATAAGHQVVLVSGQVNLAPPDKCEFHAVETTGQMYDACVQLFTGCDGVIGTAAVCDYRPRERLPDHPRHPMDNAPRQYSRGTASGPYARVAQDLCRSRCSSACTPARAGMKKTTCWDRFWRRVRDSNPRALAG